MSQLDRLNLICAGFPRCGTTALAKYFEMYTNVTVLKCPDTGAYEFNGFSEIGYNEFYNSQLLSNTNIFHKFSGYTYIKNIASLFNSIHDIRPNTKILFMLGDQYRRLQSWHAFHKSKAIRGDDKNHFTYLNREFYANCSLKEYYNKFAHNRINYLKTLKDLDRQIKSIQLIVIKQDDLRQSPEAVFEILSKELGFTGRAITKHLIVNATRLQSGISIESDSQLQAQLSDYYTETLSWAQNGNYLLNIVNYKPSMALPEHKQDDNNRNDTVVTFKPVHVLSSDSVSHNYILIIGNGPSASLIDFNTLKRLGIHTCGMNSAYRLWNKIDYRPTYYICMDSVVIKSHAPAISDLINEGKIKQFFLRNELLDLYPHFQNHPNITWFDQVRSDNKANLFSTNWITTGSWALRWMLYLGYKVISVIGVDANYQELLKETTKTGQHELIIANTPKYNPNYFFDDYQQAGDEYNIPNDPQYVAKHGTSVHADAVLKVMEDMKNLRMSNYIFDLSPLSQHNAFPKAFISNFMNIQEASLTTSFFYRESEEEEAILNAKALCYNLKQTRVSSINLLFEGDYLAFIKLLNSEQRQIIDNSIRNKRLNLIMINSRPSYLDLFNASKYSKSQIAIISNSDLIYSNQLIESICTSFAMQSPALVYCLTRWNQTENGIFLQGQVPAPPWQELSAEDMDLLSDVNYLSYDTYVFNRDLACPKLFEKIYIGTFGCDTAIAAILRATGITVTNPCLDLKAIHIDNKPRNYSDEAVSSHVLANVDAFKLSLIDALDSEFCDNNILQVLESTRVGSLSIGTPFHSLGWWYCLFRMFGASPWKNLSNSSEVRFEKFNLDPNDLVLMEDQLISMFSEAMVRGSFLEIIVNGSNGEHYLGCFNQSAKLKEIKSQLFRYDRQYVLFEDDVDEATRRCFDKFMLFVKSKFQPLFHGSSINLYSVSSQNALPASKLIFAQPESFASNKVSLTWSTTAPHIPSPPIFTRQSIRILILDPTPLGSNSATGQIKKTLFGHIDPRNILQVWEHTGQDPGLRLFSPNEHNDPNAIPSSCNASKITDEIVSFNPDVIYFRSTPSVELHRFHHYITSTLDLPSIVHVMDDWQARMNYDQNPNQNLLSKLFLDSLIISQVRLSICPKMSNEFFHRYNCNWFDLSNAVNVPLLLEEANSSKQDSYVSTTQLVIKYMGGLAGDMTAQSVLEVATAVDQLNSEGINVIFEIHTMKWYMDWANENLAHLKSVRINPLVPAEDYQNAIKAADILLVAYNFDQKSIAYTRLSMANKLPEILATGKLLFSYGPLEIATIERIQSDALGIVVSSPDPTLLKNTLRHVLIDHDLRRSKGEYGFRYAARNFSLRIASRKLDALIRLAISKKHRLKISQ
jgi:hypothetical protein